MPARDAIAIVGIGCRFPGANGPASFWNLLREGVDAVTEVPANRWDINAFYDENPRAPGKMNTRCGGFIDGADKFDAAFFAITPHEAERIDPQQRIVLEVSWEALEDAGIAPDSLSGSQTGVFAGISHSDYDRIIYKDRMRSSAFNGTGSYHSIAANRVSFVLNLRGPSMAVDTACSSSLVAVHIASQSLNSGECDLAIAGGVNMNLTPDETIALSKARAMAPDGRCKTFDSRADGYVRGEGCGLIVLKRIGDAVRDKDRIRAIILGSAVNQDGLTNGLTAPNGLAQEAVIRAALRRAEVRPADIGYVEAHGTGTKLGDPIEMKALKSVLLQDRQPNNPCWVGSVKTNIGHLEAGAGIAGLIKAVLSLEAHEIPPHLHFRQLNPYIDLDGVPIAIPVQRQPWDTPGRTRMAGVSAFGFGGTNCHMIVAEAPVQPPPGRNAFERSAHLLAISARTKPALQEMARCYAAHLQANAEASLVDVCFTGNVGRTHFDHRLAVVATSLNQLVDALSAYGLTEDAPEIVTGRAPLNARPEIAFMFTDESGLHSDSVQELYTTQPTFRRSIDHCTALFGDGHTQSKASVKEAVAADQAVFAFGYALAELLESWGIRPGAVIGCGTGEYAAACVAGVLSLEEAIRLVDARARCRAGLRVEEFKQGNHLNGMGTASGDHTLDHFYRVAAQVSYQPPNVPFLSSRTGKAVTDELCNPQYWTQHVRQPLSSSLNMQTLCGAGPYAGAVEIGAPCLSPGESGWQSLLRTIARLYVLGVKIDWAGFDKDYQRKREILPTYPFQRQRYWMEA